MTGPEKKTDLENTRAEPFSVPKFSVQVAAGFDVGLSATSVDGKVLVGSAQDVALRLTDPTVSRYHVEFEVVRDGIAVRDLGSTNGTIIASVAVREVIIRRDVEIQIGKTRLKVNVGKDRVPVGLSDATSFGRLAGGSVAMRQVYTALGRAAPASSPVLITGESGTGKELAARALHDASPRRNGPFEVVDCGGLPPTLIETELFGHERGAFTGARGERAGAFERADKGTVFLDELGEMAIELQPKLLRVLAEGEVRRVGGTKTRSIDVRVIAATNRDVRREVNAGRFRADLFYRLAVIQLRMPSLRERLEDLPVLVPALLESIRNERGIDADVTLDPESWVDLGQHQWPGNVRELRNWLEQFVVLQSPPAFDSFADDPATAPTGIDMVGLTATPLKIAKEQFERRYVETLLRETAGNLTEAARRAGVDRVTLFRTMRRYGLKRDE